jgi:acetyl esterase/lipase
MPAWLRSTTGRVVAAALVAGVVAAGWLAVHSRRPDQPLPRFVETADYLPGVAADLYLPPQPAGPTPVVVLIPGGGWQSADRAGLAPLADTLAEHGMAVVNATYRAADAGVRFPVPVSDVACAVSYAADRVRRTGHVPGPVVVLGHSAGAHLAALAALAGPRFVTGCPYPTTLPDGLIGLAGPYDVMSVQDLAYPLFGVRAAVDPAVWRAGNPMTWLGQRTGAHPLPVLLAHGTAESTVSATFTQAFGAALREAGHPVRLDLVEGADHGSIYTPEVIAGAVISWIGTLPQPSG